MQFLSCFFIKNDIINNEKENFCMTKKVELSFKKLNTTFSSIYVHSIVFFLNFIL